MHVCTIRNCENKVPERKLMCAQHWLLVPQPLKEQVLQAWEANPGDLMALVDAQLAAIEDVNLQVAGR